MKVSEGQIAEKQGDIETLEAELVGVREDLRTAGGQIAELESTNQLLKVGGGENILPLKIFLTNSGRVSSSPACPEQCGDEASGDTEGE